MSPCDRKCTPGPAAPLDARPRAAFTRPREQIRSPKELSRGRATAALTVARVLIKTLHIRLQAARRNTQERGPAACGPAQGRVTE